MVVEALTAGEVLALWELGLSGPPGRRAAALLAWADPDADPALMPVGSRDVTLLRFYGRLFGPTLPGAAQCPACSAELDVTPQVQDLVAAATPDGRVPEPAALSDVETNGYRVTYRLPTAADLATPGCDLDLLDRCVVSASGPDGRPATARDLPAPVVDALEAAMADADPGAEVVLRLACPSCGHRWGETFDPAGFLWGELDRRARRVASEIHAMANAYHWGESDILALSEQRRRLYLETVGR